MTKKQEELLNAFLAGLGMEDEALYREIAMYLSELGYNPAKQGSRINFMHSQHSKKIAKMGMTGGKTPAPLFGLRFSACRAYSEKFAAAIRSLGDRCLACCLAGECGYCAGEPETHVYVDASPAKTRYLCGARSLPIPDITHDDVEEIKRLIKEEHIYLMKHQAGIAIE